MDALGSVREYAKGKTLFESGSPAVGVYFVLQGDVRLLPTTLELDRCASQKAGPGCLLGLREAIAGDTYGATAKVLNPAKVCFVSRDDLLNYLRANPACCMEVVRILSEDLHLLYHEFQKFEVCGQRNRKLRPGSASATPRARRRT